MGWLVRDRVPDKKRQQFVDDATPALQVLAEEANRVGPLIRHQMALAPASSVPAAASPAQADAAVQLRKLAELHAAGLLAGEEYHAKRAEVINRL